MIVLRDTKTNYLQKKDRLLPSLPTAQLQEQPKVYIIIQYPQSTSVGLVSPAGILSLNHERVASVPFSKIVYFGTLNLLPLTSSLSSPPGPPSSPIRALRLLISLLLQSRILKPLTDSGDSSLIVLFEAKSAIKFGKCRFKGGREVSRLKLISSRSRSGACKCWING